MKTKVKETINNLTKSQAINWFLSDFLSEELMKYLPKTDVKKLVSKVKDVDFEFVSAKDMQKLRGKKTVPIGTFSAKQSVYT